jgi:hypothetical protein
MIEDLNKIQTLSKLVMAKHLKILEKNPFLFKRGSICFMRFRYGYTLIYTRKKGKKLYDY